MALKLRTNPFQLLVNYFLESWQRLKAIMLYIQVGKRDHAPDTYPPIFVTCSCQPAIADPTNLPVLNSCVIVSHAATIRRDTQVFCAPKRVRKRPRRVTNDTRNYGLNGGREQGRGQEVLANTYYTV